MNEHEKLLCKIADKFVGERTEDLTDIEIEVGELLVNNGFLVWANDDDCPEFGAGPKLRYDRR